jgi:ABC-type iron transport system FetAB permease component
LLVHLRVGNSRPVHTEVVVVAEVEEFLPHELVPLSVMIVLGMPKR